MVGSSSTARTCGSAASGPCACVFMNVCGLMVARPTRVGRNSEARVLYPPESDWVTDVTEPLACCSLGAITETSNWPVDPWGHGGIAPGTHWSGGPDTRNEHG